MAKDAKGHGSDARGAADAARQKMAHVVTQFDITQKNRAGAKGYYNPNALGLYLGAVASAHTDMLHGKSAADAINGSFNGTLARKLHKALGTGDTDIDTKRKAYFSGGAMPPGGLGKLTR